MKTSSALPKYIKVNLACVQMPLPPKKLGKDASASCSADVNSIPVSPEYGGKTLIGCNCWCRDLSNFWCCHVLDESQNFLRETSAFAHSLPKHWLNVFRISGNKHVKLDHWSLLHLLWAGACVLRQGGQKEFHCFISERSYIWISA